MNEQILGLITPLVALVFMTVFLVLWRRGRMERYVLAFAASYFFFGLGFLATHLIPDGNAFYLFHLTQLFYAAGTACVVWGAASRVRQRVSLVGLGLVYAIAAAALAVAVAVSTETAPRLYIVNTGYGVMFLMGVLAMLQARRREAIDTVIIFLFGYTAMQFFVRPPLTLLIEGHINAAQYRESIYYTVLNLALSVQSVITAVTLIGACVYDILRAERERGESDLLTGLRARRAFEQDAIALLERAKLEGVPVGLIVADLDDFKCVNDIYGHQVGDNAIAAFGEVITGMIRNSDIAGRVGGEEFCILAWDCNARTTEAMADRIRVKLAVHAVPGLPADHRLTASFGVATRHEGEGYGKLFARADAGLYRAKGEGRNRVCAELDPENVTPFKRGAVG